MKETFVTTLRKAGERYVLDVGSPQRGYIDNQIVRFPSQFIRHLRQGQGVSMQGRADKFGCADDRQFHLGKCQPRVLRTHRCEVIEMFFQVGQSESGAGYITFDDENRPRITCDIKLAEDDGFEHDFLDTCDSDR